MLRRLLLFSMVLSLCWTTLACGDATLGEAPTAKPQAQASSQSTEPTRLPDGKYPLQQASYDDVDGTYSLMVLNTPPGSPSIYRTANLPLARLTDAEISAGQKSYLKVEQKQPSLYLTEDAKIEYTHNVAETQTNPQTGQSETVIVRQESSFWSPFAGALAGQALGSLLFRPQYYVPPIYHSGVPLAGFGGYGSTYGQAVGRYQSRYQAPPAAIQNRQVFRTTGGLRSTRQPGASITRRTTVRDRSTGTGYGSSTLRRSNSPSSGQVNRSSRSFGSGGRVRSRRR